jgi:hypothetical protein
VALTGGTRLGPYEIVALLGSGGMGEVYRARDTKLDREVAIKVLPEQFVADPERVARFQREDAGRAESSAHCADLWAGGAGGAGRAGCDRVHRHGAGGGCGPRAAARARADSTRRSVADRAPNRGGARGGPRGGHHPSRSEPANIKLRPDGFKETTLFVSPTCRRRCSSSESRPSAR